MIEGLGLARHPLAQWMLTGWDGILNATRPVWRESVTLAQRAAIDGGNHIKGTKHLHRVY
ncbi:hypothetical protein ACVWYQ_003286 [Bradyrhizobium sp. USDA 3397]